MKTEHIEVVDYDSKWVDDFNQIKGEIEEALKLIDEQNLEKIENL